MIDTITIYVYIFMVLLFAVLGACVITFLMAAFISYIAKNTRNNKKQIEP